METEKSSTLEREMEVAQAESKEIEKLINSISIESHDGLKEAVSFVALIKEQYNGIEARRTEKVGPLKKEADEWNAIFKGPISPLTAAEKDLKNKIVNYASFCYISREELLATVATLKTPAEKQAAIEKAGKFIPPKIDGLSLREKWGGDVQDPEVIKKWAIENNRPELLLINTKVLEELTKATEGNPQVDGWAPAKKLSVAITVPKVK